MISAYYLWCAMSRRPAHFSARSSSFGPAANFMTMTHSGRSGRHYFITLQ
jgi:hypothetical protein